MALDAADLQRGRSGAARHVLALLTGDETVARRAAELGRRHNALVTLVEAWRPSRYIWGISASAGWSLPFTRAEALAVAEAEADRRVRRAAHAVGDAGLAFRCRRGSTRSVALEELQRMPFDVLVIGERCPGRRALAAALRRSPDVELVIVPAPSAPRPSRSTLAKELGGRARRPRPRARRWPHRV